MIPKENIEEFYSRFREQLANSQEWPGPFLFKFITKDQQNKINQLKYIFEGKTATFKLRNSSKKTFVSVSFLADMKSPDEVIDVYKSASTIEGIITL